MTSPATTSTPPALPALTIEDIQARLSHLRAQADGVGFTVFQGGAYDLTIIGVRARNRTQGVLDFDDTIHIIYQDEDVEWVLESFKATSDPGAHYLQNPMKRAGCAILVADKSYRHLWTIGLHRGKYEALKQHGPAIIIRDNNKDSILDIKDGGAEIPGSYIGLNLHRASGVSVKEEVGPWSAGCQVIQDPADFRRLMALAHLQESHGHGRLFSYVLLDEWR